MYFFVGSEIMNNTANAHNYASDIIKSRRNSDLSEFDKHLNEVKAKAPTAIQIFNELNQIQSSLLKSVFSGERSLDNLQDKQLKLSSELKEALLKNGFSEDYLEIKYFCPLCSDTGMYKGENCICYKKLVNEYNYNELSSQSQIENCTFDNFSLDYYPEAENELGISPKNKMREIFEYCKNYADSFSLKSSSILMYGKTGLGKTHLSLSISEAVAKKGYSVIYGSTQNLLRQTEKEYFQGQDEIINSILNCDLLILDDLGTEFESKFNTSQVYNIINTRLNYSKPTIISTNLSGKELQQRYAQRVVSRLIGDYDCLMFVGNDIRQLRK